MTSIGGLCVGRCFAVSSSFVVEVCFGVFLLSSLWKGRFNRWVADLQKVTAHLSSEVAESDGAPLGEVVGGVVEGGGAVAGGEEGAQRAGKVPS